MTIARFHFNKHVVIIVVNKPMAASDAQLAWLVSDWIDMSTANIHLLQFKIQSHLFLNRGFDKTNNVPQVLII